ncbi:MAG TPA: glycosyltransferase family 2 protein [Solirubrobacteraceae bacterium]|jgi:GT2 family glycosyltransferase|nr:glycosyltransferase family 2 protein [Solirubrobacteraceae bacterium]
MRIGAFVVHYRFWPDVRGTLDALLEQTRPPDDVLVVDDRSDDGSVDAIRAAYPAVDVLEAPRNRGVIANFQAGIDAMLARGADAIFILTHETLLEPDALEVLARRLEEDPRVGEVAPLIGWLSRPDVVFSAGGALLSRTWENPHNGMYEPLARWRGRGPQRRPWVDGACVLLRAEAVRQAGPLEVRYHHYYDDVHLGVRLNQLGWRVECHCDAVAYQQPGELAEYYRVRNRLGWLRATAPRRVFNRALAGYARRFVADLREEPALAVAIARGVRDFALGRWGPAPERYEAARRVHEPSIGGAIDLVPDPPAAEPPVAALATSDAE